VIVTLLVTDTGAEMRPIELHRHRQRSWARLPFVGHPAGGSEREQRELEAHHRTTDALLGLPAAAWSVVSHGEHRPGRASHVAVGPGGVYLIVARKPDGCVRVKDGVPWSRRSGDTRAERAHTDINRKVLESSRALERHIRADGLLNAAVHPVVVLWSEFPQRLAETSRITFVHGRDLAAWLRRRRGELDPQAQADAARVVGRLAAAAEHLGAESSAPRHAA
jgi:hypothetical protein